MDQNFNDASLDRLNRTLFTFAAYNAGPARVAGLRRKAAAQRLDPNKWLGNVEQVAAQEIGRETVTYVSNIYNLHRLYARDGAGRGTGGRPRGAPIDGSIR